jgi:hypothetical protein
VAAQRFTGTLEAGRGGGALVVLPAGVLAALGGGSRFRVTGSVAGVAFESSTMSLGAGRVCVGVQKATRAAAGLEIGDAVEFQIERDERPRTLEIPADLAEALAGDDARAAFERLSFTRRREHAESVAGAKRPETRARRLAKVLDELRAAR